MRWNLLVAAIAATWGFVSVIVAGLTLPGLALGFWRVALAATAILATLALVGRVRALVPPADRVRILALGLLLALHWALFFETLKRASVAVAILTVYTAPIFVAVLAPALLPERRSRTGLVALAVSAPGLALIALAGEGGSRAETVAVATGLGAALTYALLIIGVKTVAREVSPLAIAFWQYVVASLAVAPFLAGGRALPHPGEWPYVVLLGVALTAGLGVLYVTSLRHVTAQAAGLLAYLEPVSASLLAWAILEQRLGWEVILGGALVLAGGALVVRFEPAGTAEAPGFSPPPASAPIRVRD